MSHTPYSLYRAYVTKNTGGSMANKKVLTTTNLSSDFKLNASKKLVEVNWDNAPNGTVKKYQISRSGDISVLSGGSEQRTVLLTRKGVGIIHMDFKLKVDPASSGNLLGELPPEAPIPDNLIETQLYDGTSVWIDGGDRRIYARIKRDVRYIFDLVGFFHFE